jgi:hypothetical protein
MLTDTPVLEVGWFKREEKTRSFQKFEISFRFQSGDVERVDGHKHRIHGRGEETQSWDSKVYKWHLKLEMDYVI